ncbi:MAG: matrixin family metalloprotease [Isosphaerales bacterium]
MSTPRRILERSASRTARRRAVRPLPEVLEDRLLLYSSLGDKWTYSSRITYSFMPDGTTIGGVSSALFQTLNANYPTATWEQQIEKAATLWENVTNANLALVSDGGQAVGSSGNQQDDSRFGDIRIGAIPLASGVLAMTFLPPPANGGTDAGDIVLNSNVNWQINSSYDLMTVVAHEFGHALGLGDESTDSSAEMYGSYNAIKQALDSDDIAGIQSIYGTRQFDQFNNAGTRDNTYSTATNINSYIGSNAQLAIPSLDITTSGDSEWFYVNVPSTTNGTMTVTVQSSNLSSLSPKLVVYNSSLSLVGQASAVNSMGATISVTASVLSGQGYYFKVLAAGGPGPIGGYGLLANFGSQTQSPIAPPNTVVAQQPDQGGGSLNNGINVPGPIDPNSGSNNVFPLPVRTTIGTLTGWTESFTAFSPAPVVPVNPSVPPSNLSPPAPSPGLNSTVSTLVGTVASPPVHVTSRLKPVEAPFAKWASRHRHKHVYDHVKLKHHSVKG